LPLQKTDRGPRHETPKRKKEKKKTIGQSTAARYAGAPGRGGGRKRKTKPRRGPLPKLLHHEKWGEPTREMKSRNKNAFIRRHPSRVTGPPIPHNHPFKEINGEKAGGGWGGKTSPLKPKIGPVVHPQWKPKLPRMPSTRVAKLNRKRPTEIKHANETQKPSTKHRHYQNNAILIGGRGAKKEGGGGGGYLYH